MQWSTPKTDINTDSMDITYKDLEAPIKPADIEVFMPKDSKFLITEAETKSIDFVFDTFKTIITFSTYWTEQIDLFGGEKSTFNSEYHIENPVSVPKIIFQMQQKYKELPYQTANEKMQLTTIWISLAKQTLIRYSITH